VAQRFWSPWL